MARKYSPAAQVLYPAPTTTQFLQDVVIYFKENAHAVADLTVLYQIPYQAPTIQQQYPAGLTWGEQTPVHFSYQMFSGDISGDFYGYVMSENIQGTGSQTRYGGMTQVTVQYTLIGMTFWMQNQNDKLWKQCTPSSIATDICLQYGMRSVTENLGVSFPTQMQSSQSDWKFLADTVAQRVSARLSLDAASTLYFTEYTTPIPTVDGSIPTFTLSKKQGAVDSLRSFSGYTGDLDPVGGYRVKQVANSTSPSMPPVSYTPSRDTDAIRPVQTFTKRYTLWPGRNYNETQQYLVADSEPLWTYAEATTDGEPRNKVGTFVNIQGDGVTVDHQGLWLIRSATHTIHQVMGNSLLNTYTCDLTLGRNQPNRFEIVGSPLNVGTDFGTVLIGQRWRAQQTTKMTS